MLSWVPGVACSGVSCGVKADGALDLGLLVAERPAAWAGTFTLNAAAAPSVGWSRSLLGGRLRAVVVNSGNANACTGRAGTRAVGLVTAAAAEALGCGPHEVAVASTGPIGKSLPVHHVIAGIPRAVELLGPDVEPFASAIVTTDTTTKVSSAPAGDARVVGVAKGAAMVAPSMATMLVFLATDARVAPGSLQGLLSDAAAATFGRICVDACESTNDSVFLLSTETGAETSAAALAGALREVCSDLASQIVKDAEGASRVMRIEVSGARSEEAALSLARAVAASALWRAAAHGGDPNWGRILAALGSVDRSLDLSSLEVRIGPEPVFSGGEPAGSLELAAKAMDADEFSIGCVVGRGPGTAEVLSADLSPEYVELNARGTT